jgi:hypothetical protein
MTAYEVAAWADFANTVAGGAAALAGLLFVGLSLNLAEVLKYPGVPARAAATLTVTVAILLTDPARVLTSMVLLCVPAVLLIVGAVSLWSQSGGGLYWVTAAIAMGFASATGNAWVLLVEIKR